jgi:hypothetical protein
MESPRGKLAAKGGSWWTRLKAHFQEKEREYERSIGQVNLERKLFGIKVGKGQKEEDNYLGQTVKGLNSEKHTFWAQGNNNLAYPVRHRFLSHKRWLGQRKKKRRRSQGNCNHRVKEKETGKRRYLPVFCTPPTGSRPFAKSALGPMDIHLKEKQGESNGTRPT